MKLRPALLPPKLRKAEMAELVAEIEYLDGMEAEDAVERAAALNLRWGSQITDDHFATFHQSSDPEDLARLVIASAAKLPTDVTRDELVEIVGRVLSVDSHIDWYLRLAAANVPHPGIVDLIFYPKVPNPTAEQIVDQALAFVPRGPILL